MNKIDDEKQQIQETITTPVYIKKEEFPDYSSMTYNIILNVREKTVNKRKFFVYHICEAGFKHRIRYEGTHKVDTGHYFAKHKTKMIPESEKKLESRFESASPEDINNLVHILNEQPALAIERNDLRALGVLIPKSYLE